MQGTLEMLVLRTLTSGPLHGYGIAKFLHAGSNRQLEIEFGSLYPALKRLELKGWLTSAWEISELNRRAKYYRLTPAGRRHIHAEHSKWIDFVKAVATIMEPNPGGTI